jgi:serine/threonine protein kinase/tetratricopeptide (TPR) repeat protein
VRVIQPGSELGRYRIVERLGSGGMGSVYRATDPRLERDVALKVLHPDAEAGPGEERRRRLRLEARALSRLLHPNIATLFDLDSSDGVDFLVLEYVPGNTLARALEAGPLPEARARAIALEVAGALEAAHEQGVVHRDLKPGNIILNPRGRAKVLDFGLASFQGSSSVSLPSLRSRDHGRVAGTMPYMAPEQIRGERTDARSDVWAVGVMMYEMCAGSRPFAGEDYSQLLYRIVNELPAPLRERRPAVTIAYAAIVERCLEKDPARRYADAFGLSRALRGDESGDRVVSPASAPPAITDSTVPGRIRSLAVLPLANRSGDPGQEFFVDGMTDALIADLAQIGALRVISRTSAMRFKGSDRPLPDIARELRVDGIVEGSALLAGGRVRITVQLIEAASDRSLWAKSYERELTDILTLQGEVAHAIANEVRVQVTPEERDRLERKGPVNPAAHVAYLHGRFLWNRWSTEAFRQSLERYREAIEADPGYALAWAGLADSYNTLGNTNAMRPAEAYSKAREAAERGLALDPSLAELHASLAYVHRFHDWDWTRAERGFLRALELNPGYATGRRWYAQFLSGLGRHPEAIAEAERALESDPLSLVIHTAVGDVLFYARRYERAVAYYRRCVELDPTFGPGHTDMARALEHLGRHDEAIAEFMAGMSTTAGAETPASTGLATLLAAAGRRGEALRMLEELVARSERQYVSPYGIASAFAVAGENERALDWLEKAFEQRDGTLVWIKVHPRMDGLRAEPRFRELLARLHLDH